MKCSSTLYPTQEIKMTKSSWKFYFQHVSRYHQESKIS